jgi:hypothetical protein
MQDRIWRANVFALQLSALPVTGPAALVGDGDHHYSIRLDLVDQLEWKPVQKDSP